MRLRFEPSLQSSSVSVGGVVALLGLASAGCSPPEDDIDLRADPVVVCAAGATLNGIDVSVYQGQIDWAAVRSSGRVFAIARVGSGNPLDANFDANWAGMKAAGIVRGAYYYFRPTASVTGQADAMIDAMRTLEPGDLPPTLDVEDTGGLSATELTRRIHVWIDRVQAATKRIPMIYTGLYFWNDNVRSSDFGHHPLWVPQYGVTCPNTPRPWTNWHIHQTSNTGRVSGIQGDVDLNKFNGSMADLQAFVASTIIGSGSDGVGDGGSFGGDGATSDVDGETDATATEGGGSGDDDGGRGGMDAAVADGGARDTVDAAPVSGDGAVRDSASSAEAGAGAADASSEGPGGGGSSDGGCDCAAASARAPRARAVALIAFAAALSALRRRPRRADRQ